MSYKQKVMIFNVKWLEIKKLIYSFHSLIDIHFQLN